MGNPPVPEIISPREAHLPQSGARPRLAVGKTRQISRLTDRLTGRKGRIQCRFTVLKDHLKPAFRPVEGREIGGFPLKKNLARIGGKKARQNRGEGRLPGTGGSALHPQRNVMQHRLSAELFSDSSALKAGDNAPAVAADQASRVPGRLQQRRRLLPAESG